MVQNSRISNRISKGLSFNKMGCSSVYGEAEWNWWSSVFLWECPFCHLILHVPCWVETLHSLCCLISLWHLKSLAFPSLKNFPLFSPTLMIALSSLCSPSFSPFIPNDSVPLSSFPSSLCMLFLELRTVTLKSLPQPKFLFLTQGHGPSPGEHLSTQRHLTTNLSLCLSFKQSLPSPTTPSQHNLSFTQLAKPEMRDSMSISLFPPHLTSKHPPPAILYSQYFLIVPSLHSKHCLSSGIFSSLAWIMYWPPKLFLQPNSSPSVQAICTEHTFFSKFSLIRETFEFYIITWFIPSLALQTWDTCLFSKYYLLNAHKGAGPEKQ